jgi:hypothetical protein
MNIKWAQIRRRVRQLAVLLAFLGLVVPCVAGQYSAAGAAESPVTCTNPASGAQWQIRVDYERGTVDSYPARITAANITWHDASDGGNYTLDRKSGKLTVVVASSTGGYFIYDRCKLDN